MENSADTRLITDYQAKYLAYELTKRCPSDSVEKLAGAVAGAQVDLNPHQVDAALFAFRSPLSKGAILADEVGLGKTIEAGLVISQMWAERKRRILAITPSNLRQQQTFEMLKARLNPICHRTLRRQVTAYVPFTKRHALVEPFFEINEAMTATRRKLLENFDDEVREKLRIREDASKTILEPLRGKSGHLAASLFTVESLDQTEDHIILAACTEDGTMLDDDQARRLLSLPAQASSDILNFPIPETLQNLAAERQKAIQRDISARNARFYEEEATKLDGWADDLKAGLEREIKEFDRQIKETRRAASFAVTLEEKLESQKQIKAIEALRNEKRRSLFEAQDKIDKNREELISRIESKLSTSTSAEMLFNLIWSITN